MGGRIKEQRIIRGISQEKVAELVGVSRQAVSKWEAGQSAPSTENLFKLAEVLGTTVSALMEVEETEKDVLAEKIHLIYQKEEKKKTEERRTARRRNFLATAGVVAGYFLLYLVGRILGGSTEYTSVLGLLFGTSAQFSYLYGWLLHRNLFWMAVVISGVPALFGKYKFSYTTLFAFALGLFLGETLGENPAGAEWGMGHYGWAIWGGIFIVSVGMGIALEKIAPSGLDFSSRKLWVWGAVFAAGIAGVLLLVLAGIPQTYHG